MYCSNCGAQIVSNSNFCSNCGNRISSSSLPAEVQSVPAIASSSNGDYRLIFVDHDECSVSDAEELIQDLLGYSAADADRFVDAAPVEIADNLTLLQARTLAQVFVEYGCQMTVIDEQGDVVDAADKATSPVLDQNGNLLTKAAQIIGALTLVNCVTSLRRYKKPSLLERLFKPRYLISRPKKRVPYRYKAPRAPQPVFKAPARRPGMHAHTRPFPSAHRTAARKRGRR